MIGSGDEKEDEDLDGVPLDGAALLKSAFMRGIPGAAASVTDSPSHDRVSRIQENVDSEYEDDIDGVPCKFQIKYEIVCIEKFTIQRSMRKMFSR